MYIFVYIHFILVTFLCNIDCITLDTNQGTLKGETLQSRDGRPFYAFYNIPYAEPPVGDLRFESPVPPKPWNGIRDATILPPACLSYEDNGEIVGEEDCLYLNVYTPKITNDTLLPVMVFVFGGRFMYGNALPDRYGAHYFMDKDVVLITFHYRLGVLGFLSTEDEVIPGNYGLKDEVAVLQWVQNYINAFGGDKNRVTIFGGSSGGMSASLALISPLTKGLFHRVISQSGFPTHLETPGIARLNAWKFASFAGCNDENVTTSEALLACLKKLPAEELAIHNSQFYTLGHLLPLLPWGPVIENEKVPGAFLVDEPQKLLARQTDIPWIFGINSDDGGMFAIFAYFSPLLSVIEELSNNYEKYFPLIFRYAERYANDPERIAYLTKTFKEHYFGDKSVRESPHAFSKMIADLLYLPTIKEIVKLYKGPKYLYLYDHRNKESFAGMYGSNEDMGVIHGDELISMFNWSSVITPVTDGIDLVVSKQMLQLWTNFAAKGDPNDEGEQIWRPVDSPNINYLHIKDGILETREEFFKSEYEFLDKISYLDHR